MRSLALLVVSLALAGCASTGGGDPRDPWEGFNRKSFAFNDALDRAVLKPVAQGYEKLVPGFVREGVNNFYSNIEDIGTSLNNLLQGKVGQSLSDAGRFAVNTTLGIAGLWDIATPLGLEKHDEDFGQTLGWWGVPPGPYFVIPFLGPSTVRDAPAKAIDPSWYYTHEYGANRWYWTWWGVDKVRTRANLLKAESVLEQAALDRYTFVRDLWLQRRRNAVFDGHPPREDDDMDEGPPARK